MSRDEAPDSPGAWRCLIGPLLSEPAAETRRRGFRFFILAPFGTVAGVAFGVFGADLLGVSPLDLSLLGVGAALVLVYLVTLTETWIRLHGWGQRGWEGVVLELVVDVIGGGILGHFLGQALGTHVVFSLAGGAALMAGYSQVASRLLLDDLVDAAFRILTGQVSAEQKPDLSYPDSLAARGRVDEALAAYDEAMREYPDDPTPLLRGARMLRDEGRCREAVERYRRALGLPEIEAPQAASAALQIREICLTELDDPDAARPALRTLVERFPDARPVSWLREELEESRPDPGSASR